MGQPRPGSASSLGFLPHGMLVRVKRAPAEKASMPAWRFAGGCGYGARGPTNSEAQPSGWLLFAAEAEVRAVLGLCSGLAPPMAALGSQSSRGLTFLHRETVWMGEPICRPFSAPPPHALGT